MCVSRGLKSALLIIRILIKNTLYHKAPPTTPAVTLRLQSSVVVGAVSPGSVDGFY